MSGVLLSVAFYAVLRVKAVADGALGPAFPRTLLLVLALGTLATAAPAREQPDRRGTRAGRANKSFNLSYAGNDL